MLYWFLKRMRGNIEPICFGEYEDNALPKDNTYLPGVLFKLGKYTD